MGKITEVAIKFQDAYEAFRPLEEAKDFKKSLKPLKDVIKAVYQKNGAVSFPVGGKIEKKIKEWQGKFAAKGMIAGTNSEVSEENKAKVEALSQISKEKFVALDKSEIYQTNKAAKKEYHQVMKTALEAGKTVEVIQAKLRATEYFSTKPDAKAVVKVGYYIANRKIVLEEKE